jgi:transposase-like protein
MKTSLLNGLAALFVALPAVAFAQATATVQSAEIALAREVIQQYVQTRQNIARIKNEWEAYQELTWRRIDLYEREIEQLRADIARGEEATTQAEREISRIRADIATMRQANSIVMQALPAIEDRLRELAQFFPPPLKGKLQRFVLQLGKGRQASDRMAVVIGILNEVDKFNTEYTYVTEDRRMPTGETKVVDVIYLGLAVGYYADRDGTTGGVLTPAAPDWAVSERLDLAPAIRDAVRFHRNEIKPAQLVDLPVEVQNVQLGR